MNSEARAKLMDKKLPGLGLLPQAVCTCELNSCRNSCGYSSKIAFLSRKPSFLCVVCVSLFQPQPCQDAKFVKPDWMNKRDCTTVMFGSGWCCLRGSCLPMYEGVCTTRLCSPTCLFREFKVHELEMFTTPTTSTTRSQGSHPLRLIIIKSSEPMV